MSPGPCPTCGLTRGELLDNRALREWLGVSEAAADRLMRAVPKVAGPAGLRKVYVRRGDVERLLDGATRSAA